MPALIAADCRPLTAAAVGCKVFTIAGHDHFYERIVLDGYPYFVNGAGASRSTDSPPPYPGAPSGTTWTMGRCW
jgi:hypothetical protein